MTFAVSNETPQTEAKLRESNCVIKCLERAGPDEILRAILKLNQ